MTPPLQASMAWLSQHPQRCRRRPMHLAPRLIRHCFPSQRFSIFFFNFGLLPAWSISRHSSVGFGFSLIFHGISAATALLALLVFKLSSLAWRRGERRSVFPPYVVCFSRLLPAISMIAAVQDSYIPSLQNLDSRRRNSLPLQQPRSGTAAAHKEP